MEKDDLALLIRRRREELGLTQLELAEQSSVHLRSVNSIEAGKANPSWETLQKLIYVLKLEIVIRRS